MNEGALPHVALVKHRTRHKEEWLEIGKGRLETNRDTGQITCHVQLNRMPIGGFDGYVVLIPPGSKPPSIDPVTPRRPNPEQTESDGV
jgi:hypothetical protein